MRRRACDSRLGLGCLAVPCRIESQAPIRWTPILVRYPSMRPGERYPAYYGGATSYNIFGNGDGVVVAVEIVANTVGT